MYSSMWFMSIVALLVVDVRTGALKDTDIQPSRCYACPAAAANGTACAQSSEWITTVCPVHRPLCATVAVAPDFTSSLTCAAATKNPCSFNDINNSLELTCVCSGNLCNSPFTHELRIEIVNFTTRDNFTDMIQVFFQSSRFANVSEENLYNAITKTVPPSGMRNINSSQLTTLTSVPPTINIISIMRDSEKPKAEALKLEVTVPSEDDEDEGEGSGTYEDTRSHSHAASDPAAPSSFLPAKDNSGSTLCKDLFLSTLVIYSIV